MESLKISLKGLAMTLGLSFLLLGQGAVAQSSDAGPNDGLDAGFLLGGRCADLSYVTPHEMSVLTDRDHVKHFGAFCLPDDDTACDVYSELLLGLGVLEGAPSGPFCRFVPVHQVQYGDSSGQMARCWDAKPRFFQEEKMATCGVRGS